MFAKTKDPLLLAGRVLTILMQGFMAIAAVALTIALPAILFFQDKIDAEIAIEHGEGISAFPIIPVAGMMLIGLALVAIVFFFFGKLRQIIETVGEGDPFVPENADRLTAMGWLALGAYLLVGLMAGVATFVAEWTEQLQNSDFHFAVGFDLSSIILIVTLFILARVFRRGTEMRDDLEGTV